VFYRPRAPVSSGFLFMDQKVHSRIVFFIDGFNLYHSLDASKKYHCYKWLDLKKLAKSFLRKTDDLKKIYYFTALATWKNESMNRHRKYIRALELGPIEVVYGKFKSRDKRCHKCKKVFSTYEEKQTDVNIAIQLFESAIKNEFDTALIISGDSDLIPSINAVKRNFPNKKVGIIIPIDRNAEELKNTAHFHMKMKTRHLESSRFPDEIDIGNGAKLKCPPKWKS